MFRYRNNKNEIKDLEAVNDNNIQNENDTKIAKTPLSNKQDTKNWSVAYKKYEILFIIFKIKQK